MDRKVFIIASVVMVVALCFYIFLRNDGKTYNWNEDYQHDSKHPYGLHIMNEMLNTYGSDSALVVEENLVNLELQ